jgi:hypothetical protein
MADKEGKKRPNGRLPPVIETIVHVFETIVQLSQTGLPELCKELLNTHNVCSD